MGNYINSILTQGISKKYSSINVLVRQLFFGFQKDHLRTIKKYYTSHGLSLHRPFVNTDIYQISLLPYGLTWVKDSIWQMKFQYNRRLCYTYGDIIADILIDILSEVHMTHNFTNPIVCCVPSHKSTIRSRNGYYSTQIMTKRVHKQLSHMRVDLMINALCKHKKTIRQSHTTSRTERLRNQIGAFSLSDESSVKNRNIIIIDDVYTTGATMNECTKLLFSAGAHRIIQVTIAH